MVAIVRLYTDAMIMLQIHGPKTQRDSTLSLLLLGPLTYRDGSHDLIKCFCPALESPPTRQRVQNGGGYRSS